MSRVPAKYNMTVIRGATWEDEFTYADDAGVPIDLTGYQARMQVRSLVGQFGTTTTTTLMLELSTTGATPRLLWDTAATGTLKIVVPPTAHAVLNPANVARVQYAYSIELYQPAGANPEYVLPLVQGKITVKGEVTR
jgi:hypothetical protein